MIRVLVVDDDFMVAKVHAAFVARTPGFEVAGVAHSGATALVSVASLHPDLVLLDIHLPDMSGLEVLRRLRELEPDVDVLVISAAKEAEAVRTALRGGVVNYLLKPFDQDALCDRLQRYAATHRSLAEPTVAQTDLDRLFGAAPQRPVAARLPKGLSPESAALVAGVLQAAGDDLSASGAPSAGCPGSPAATSSTSWRSAGRRCGCSTGGGPAAAPLRLADAASRPLSGRRPAGRSP
jgi:response regulator of citrate/malate metabolism